MKRVLYACVHRPDRAPGQRFRFEQYMERLREVGFEYDHSHLLTAHDDRHYYVPGNYLRKFLLLVRSFLKRWREIARLSDYDIVFVQREAFMTRHTFFERAVARSSAKMIFDFDDSIWLDNVSQANRRLGWLKNAAKTSDLIKMADLVFAGNEFLRDYAKARNERVLVVPTTIDTDLYQPVRLEKDAVCIGWSGSFSTIKHFEYALPVLKRIKDRFGDRVYFKVIGDGSYEQATLGISGQPWRFETEVEDLSEIDIGIMPLRDNEWERGKCGLKGLQYMALGIATVMSPVGVNQQIIKDGENGFLAADDDQWFGRLSSLIEDDQLRQRIGRAGRQTVVKDYSVEANLRLYKRAFEEVLAS